MGTLTVHRKAATMAQTTVTANIHQTLDVAGNFTAEVTLNLVGSFKLFTDFIHFISRNVINITRPIDAGGIKDFQSRSTADAVNVGQRNINTFAAGQIYTCNSSHSMSPALVSPDAACVGGFRRSLSARPCDG